MHLQLFLRELNAQSSFSPCDCNSHPIEAFISFALAARVCIMHFSLRAKCAVHIFADPRRGSVCISPGVGRAAVCRSTAQMCGRRRRSQVFAVASALWSRPRKSLFPSHQHMWGRERMQRRLHNLSRVGIGFRSAYVHLLCPLEKLLFQMCASH